MMSPVQLTSMMLEAASHTGVPAARRVSGLYEDGGRLRNPSGSGKREADILIFAGGIANPELVEGTGA